MTTRKQQLRELAERLGTYADRVARRAAILRRFADQQAGAGYAATADTDADQEETLGADLQEAVRALRALAAKEDGDA